MQLKKTPKRGKSFFQTANWKLLKDSRSMKIKKKIGRELVFGESTI